MFNCFPAYLLYIRKEFIFLKTALNLMNYAAVKVMAVIKDIVLSFGQSDEYTFVLNRTTSFCHRRASKIESIINCVFTSQYIEHWNAWMGGRVMNGLPTFDARTVPYASDALLRDYLSWRQADVHINNLYNTCFWKLVCDKQMENSTAEEYLRIHGTYSDDKRRLLQTMFNIDYDQLPEMYKKGTILLRKLVNDASATLMVPLHVDMIQNHFWIKHNEILSCGPIRPFSFGDAPMPQLCVVQLNDSVKLDVAKIDDDIDSVQNGQCIQGLLCKRVDFELDHSFVPGCWTVIHIRGNAFRNFTAMHDFQRPNDDRGKNDNSYFTTASNLGEGGWKKIFVPLY